MKKMVLLLAAFLLLGAVGCGSENYERTIHEELGINVSDGIKEIYADTHGGFRGDGNTYVVLQFLDDDVRKQIEEDPQWKEFPLDETVRALLYGTEDSGHVQGPYFKDRDGKAVVPEIENGYYRLIDRQEETIKAEEEDILSRYSMNLTIGIYDIDADKLYFCKIDT